MDTLLSAAVLALVVLIAAAAFPMLYEAWRRATSADGDLQLWRAMHRRGLGPDDAAAEPASLARAVRRCVMCPSIAQCDAWLASGAREGCERFCPNAALFEKLESAKRHAAAPLAR